MCQCDMRVGSLVDWRTCSWHTPLVEALFPPKISQRIFSTYIPSWCRHNRLYWARIRNGDFIVKSAYFLPVFSKFSVEVGSVSVDLWKKFWALNLPPKYGLFICKGFTWYLGSEGRRIVLEEGL